MPQSHYSIIEAAINVKQKLRGDTTDYYEEENTVRYIGGYILTQKKEKDTLQEAIDDLKRNSTQLLT